MYSFHQKILKDSEFAFYKGLYFYIFDTRVHVHIPRHSNTNTFSKVYLIYFGQYHHLMAKNSISRYYTPLHSLHLEYNMIDYLVNSCKILFVSQYFIRLEKISCDYKIFLANVITINTKNLFVLAQLTRRHLKLHLKNLQKVMETVTWQAIRSKNPHKERPNDLIYLRNEKTFFKKSFIFSFQHLFKSQRELFSKPTKFQKKMNIASNPLAKILQLFQEKCLLLLLKINHLKGF